MLWHLTVLTKVLLFFNEVLAQTLKVEPPALHIAGGVLLFLIARVLE